MRFGQLHLATTTVEQPGARPHSAQSKLWSKYAYFLCRFSKYHKTQILYTLSKWTLVQSERERPGVEESKLILGCICLLEDEMVQLQEFYFFFKWTWRPFDVTDVAFTWIRSWMFANGKHRAATATLAQGVLQGSVLGPVLFIIYMLPLSHIIWHHKSRYSLLYRDLC